MTKSSFFAPTPGYFHLEADKSEPHGWHIIGNHGRFAGVPFNPKVSAWETECNAALLAGSPEMLNALVIAHNRLSTLATCTEIDVARRVAQRTQGGIRGGLIKAIGGDNDIFRIAGHALIKVEWPE